MTSPQFVLCPHCEGLLVSDPVTGQPPTHCRHCGQAVDRADAGAAGMPGSASAPATAAGAPPTPETPPLAQAGSLQADHAPAAASAIAAVRADGQPDHAATARAATEAAAESPAGRGFAAARADERRADERRADERPQPSAHAAEEPASPAPAGTTPGTDTSPGTGTDAAHADADQGAAVAAESGDTVADTTGDHAAMPPARPAPRFAMRTTSHAGSARAWGVVAVLAGALVMQLLLTQRARLAADARWRPAVLAACTVLRCQVPVWHDAAAFEMLERNVAATPGQPGVLTVSAHFRQQARWAQAWPVLQVQLLDADGRVLGVGRFDARQYLGRAPDTPLLAPGRDVQARLQVREPAGGAVAFQFDFL
jgi:hypothetical protein